MSNQKNKKKEESKVTDQKKDGGFYARKPIEEIKAFKSKDGKSIVVRVIKTCIFPTNYIRAIVENESPYNSESGKKEVSGDEQ